MADKRVRKKLKELNVGDKFWFADVPYYIRYMPQPYDDDLISIPTGLDIMTVLDSTEDFLKDSVRLYEEKESDEEYKTYLRLKEKYESKRR